jgi:hypothetical protein
MWYLPCVFRGLLGVAAASFVVAAVVLAPGSRAHAYEDQIGVGLGAGYANLDLPGLPAHGLALDAAATLGLDDIWALRARFTYGYHPDSLGAVHTFVPSGDVLYLIDILEWVPYVGAGLDAVVALPVVGPVQSNLGIHLAFGLDWLLSRRWLLELDLRPVLIVTALDEGPFYFVSTLSAQYLFDY